MEDRYNDIIKQIQDLFVDDPRYRGLKLVAEIWDIMHNKKENKYQYMLTVLDHCFPLLAKSDNTNLVIDTWLLMQRLKIKLKN